MLKENCLNKVTGSYSLIQGGKKKEEKRYIGLKVSNCFVLHKWLQDLAWKILAFPLQHLEIKGESHRAQNDKSVF